MHGNWAGNEKQGNTGQGTTRRFRELHGGKMVVGSSDDPTSVGWFPFIQPPSVYLSVSVFVFVFPALSLCVHLGRRTVCCRLFSFPPFLFARHSHSSYQRIAPRFQASYCSRLGPITHRFVLISIRPFLPSRYSFGRCNLDFK